jgi:hypothetical protein
MELLTKKIIANMWTVEKIISGNTIEVKPSWNWAGKTGNVVVITSYSLSSQSLPEEVAKTIAVNRLTSLLKTSNNITTIVLAAPTRIDEEGRLLCDVLLSGASISTYFPDFKK